LSTFFLLRYTQVKTRQLVKDALIEAGESRNDGCEYGHE